MTKKKQSKEYLKENKDEIDRLFNTMMAENTEMKEILEERRKREKEYMKKYHKTTRVCKKDAQC